ncbi:MAG TPA: hypothetical protein V6C65_42050, partial [Allocoleopsis sp.]
MKRNWQIKRDFAEHSNGQLRWDKAYQLLMRITSETVQTAVPVQQDGSPPLIALETSHDNCPL